MTVQSVLDFLYLLFAHFCGFGSDKNRPGRFETGLIWLMAGVATAAAHAAKMMTANFIWKHAKICYLTIFVINKEICIFFVSYKTSSGAQSNILKKWKLFMDKTRPKSARQAENPARFSLIQHESAILKPISSLGQKRSHKSTWRSDKWVAFSRFLFMTE